MSKVADLKNGAVFEIKLDDEIGYGYVKIMLSKQLKMKVNFDMFIVKVYNVFSEKSKKGNFNPHQFETDDLLIFPPNMYFRPVLRGKDRWVFIGDSMMTNEDYVLPDYIDGIGFEDKKKEVKERIQSGKQEPIIHNFMNQRMYSSSFDDIKHLWFWSSQCSEAINRFLSIYWMEKKSIDSKKFYGRHILKKGKRKDLKYYALKKGYYLYNEMTEDFLKMEKGVRLKALKVEDYKYDPSDFLRP